MYDWGGNQTGSTGASGISGSAEYGGGAGGGVGIGSTNFGSSTQRRLIVVRPVRRPVVAAGLYTDNTAKVGSLEVPPNSICGKPGGAARR